MGGTLAWRSRWLPAHVTDYDYGAKNLRQRTTKIRCLKLSTYLSVNYTS